MSQIFAGRVRLTQHIRYSSLLNPWGPWGLYYSLWVGSTGYIGWGMREMTPVIVEYEEITDSSKMMFHPREVNPFIFSRV